MYIRNDTILTITKILDQTLMVDSTNLVNRQVHTNMCPKILCSRSTGCSKYIDFSRQIQVNILFHNCG